MQSEGTSFFLSQYGVRVVSAADTFTVWKPKDYHGTSLPYCTPMSADEDMDDFSQVSLAIVTPSGLPGQWKKLQEKEISLEEAEESIAMGRHE